MHTDILSSSKLKLFIFTLPFLLSTAFYRSILTRTTGVYKEYPNVFWILRNAPISDMIINVNIDINRNFRLYVALTWLRVDLQYLWTCDRILSKYRTEQFDQNNVPAHAWWIVAYYVVD